MLSPTTYTFGTFRLDTARRMLFSGNEITPLPERAFQLLLLLIEAGGDVVSKETLATRVWNESTVSDANLSQHIYLLRQKLREKASDRSYIMTVSGRGFRFAAPITAAITGQTPSPIDVKPPAAAPSPAPIARSGRAGDPFFEYCRGMQLLERRSTPELWSAIEAFENAIRLDDTCARYFIGFARCYAVLAELGDASPGTAFAKARSAIGRAIGIDPRSAPAHAVLSEILLFGDWDWSGARGASDHALRLDSGSSLVRRNAARLHVALGDYTNAQIEAQSALMLLPSCAVLQILFAQATLLAGDYELALSVLSNLIELQPGCHIARRNRARAYLSSGHHEKAMWDLQLLSHAPDASGTDVALLSRALAVGGDAGGARQTHARLLEMSSTRHVFRLDLALSAVGLGEEREALRHLENAYQAREPVLVFLKSLRCFDPLRNTAEFAQLLANIGPATRRDGTADVSYGLDTLEDLPA
jgi:DNA-binding winged helix-turn-helix (wHTH) protein/tetratricopeptide (TPR) repeat protein